MLDEGALGAGQEWNQLVRVHRSACPRTLDLLGVRVEGEQRFGGGGVVLLMTHTGTRAVGESQRNFLGRAALSVLQPSDERDLFEPGADGQSGCVLSDYRESARWERSATGHT